MRCDVITHPEAAEELRDALRWYGKSSTRAPARLLEEYDAHIAQIRSSPDSIRFIYQEYRRLNLDRFPFAIIYRIRGEDVFIIALMHEKRHPDLLEASHR